MNVSFVATVDRVFDSTYELATLVMTFERSLAGETSASGTENTGFPPVPNVYVLFSSIDVSLLPDDEDDPVRGAESSSNSANRDAAPLFAKKLKTMGLTIVYMMCRD